LRKTGVEGNRLIVLNTDGIGGGHRERRREKQELRVTDIVSYTDVIIEGVVEMNKESSYQIRMGLVVVIERGTEKDKS
jgi:hypothetical protein